MGRNSKLSRKKQNNNIESLADLVHDLENPNKAEYEMHFTKHRLASFNNWPFDADSKCNPSSLAEAGFYYIPTNEAPDAVRCFCCYKELDGWESEDCPWAEHKKHSSECAFLSLRKPVLKLTLDEFLKLECERQKNKVRKYYHTKKQAFEEYAQHMRSELTKLNG